ncbi:MAG TPA: hypothetical protein VL173_03010 [Vicinamibacterales bacterium]|jgi:hypothetical protein|nr:hypothetical protein [Vicinamibacterales bacterium]
MRGALLAFVLLVGTTVRAQTDPITRLGEYVERYYTRAQSILTEETIVIQPINADLSAEGFPRRAVYELRVEWDPTAPTASERAKAVRQLIKASGPAIFDPGDEKCADPPSTTPEPLAFLLPDNQQSWNFAMGKPDRVDGRTAMTVEYTPRNGPPPSITSDHDCLFADLSGQTRGRLWADPESGEILRIDERLTGVVDVKIPKELQKPKGKTRRPDEVTYERATSSTRYKRVTFTDPDETILLPASIDSVTIHRSDRRVSRLRITQTFAKYRRFVTDSRILPAASD